MSLYTIGDLHLSLGVNKPMDIFGKRWHNALERLENSFSTLTESDTVVLCGDTSWGMTLEEALLDFQFLARFPARFLLVKGNHDYWWTTARKLENFWHCHGCRNLALLHNNAFACGGKTLCGTRGWFLDEEAGAQHEKVFHRELLRLRASLEAGVKLGGELICFLHYPPVYEGYRCGEILEILHEYGVKRCYFGHLHGAACEKAIKGDDNGTVFHLISADHLSFQPLLI